MKEGSPPGKGYPGRVIPDSEVLNYFKQGGRGYQSRINAVLLGYVRSQQRRHIVAERSTEPGDGSPDGREG